MIVGLKMAIPEGFSTISTFPRGYLQLSVSQFEQLSKVLNSETPHVVSYFFRKVNRSAFPITIRSEHPIAAAHKIGLMNPNAASGIPMQL
jgi:hypothetical protein